MKILIIGSGYVGTGLALFWFNKGHHITVLTHSIKKLKILNQITHKCIISDANDENELYMLMRSTDAIVVTSSKDLVTGMDDSYLTTSKAIKQAAIRLEMPRTLIYTESTALYGDHKGQWVDESSPLKASSEEAKVLIETEKTFLSLAELGWIVCVFRVAEIYGTGRELYTQIKDIQENKFAPYNWQNYTNMVHQEDVVEAIDYALMHKLEGIYNLADNDHLSKKELFDKICNQLHLPKIQWENLEHKGNIPNKRVSNNKIKSAGYVFRYPNRLLM